ncbi:threonine dehydratase biosynthetic, chloroplastic-like [Solanum dulcamara]|uniref:threonine dehydratase biosynthetic, chloroplastic-like n=1 Tax=Solanum dulcamara TaxID=45834 RepID=UPI002484FD53|nr:threonine dehydratase biosynthetic, chloroplastic-like [Solanum dulcamara]
MEFLCLAPSHNFTISPKFTPFSSDRITTPLRDMKMYRNMGGSRVKPLALPLKRLIYPSDSSAVLPVSEPVSLPVVQPGQLIENKRIPYDPDELLQYLLDMLASPVYNVAKVTPLEPAKKISDKLGVKFYIKREDKQDVFSFKIRGAYNMMSSLSQEQLDKGVVTASAGNHAQGVAVSAATLKCQATIVMPETTPEIKVEAVRSLGGDYVTIKPVGQTFDEAQAEALRLVEENGYIFVSPFDDPGVIKGQGTVGMEINHQLKDIYAVFVPVGGGGLIAGVAAYFKQVAPNTKIIGVEPYGAASMTYSLYKGERIKLENVDTFADGVAVAQVGAYNFQKCQELIDGMVLVHRDDISAAIKDVYDEGRNILETSGAVSIAGAQAYCKYYNIQNENIVTIASGANMDFSKLKLVADYAAIGAGEEALLATVMPEEQGSFLKFIQILGSFNITEFTYRYSAERKKAVALYSVDIDENTDIKAIIEKLNSEGFHTVDLSHHDVANEHLRHLVAGGASNPSDEILCQFIFPEIAGALRKFLYAFSPRWNITLFRYREQGDINASVLVGFQVPKSEMDEFQNQANNLGYAYSFENLDEVYKLIRND